MSETITCGVCLETFQAPASHRRKFCSKPCMYTARRKSTEQLKDRYRKVRIPVGHPLAINSQYIREHRIILWDKIGRGPHECYHCGTSVSWFPDSDTGSASLDTDHLDRDPKNNDPSNLAASCHQCNTMNRDYTVRDDEMFIVRPNGTRLRAKEIFCTYCGKSKLVRRDLDMRLNRYCDKTCKDAARRRRP